MTFKSSVRKYVSIGVLNICMMWAFSIMAMETDGKNDAFSQIPNHPFNLKASPIEKLNKLNLAFHMRSTTPPPTAMDFRTHKWCSPVKNQKHIGACTGFSFAGAMETVALMEGLPLVILSPSYVYANELKMNGMLGSDEGASIVDSLTIGTTKGVCTEEKWPFRDSSDDYSILPSADCDVVAREHVDLDIISLARVNVDVDDIKDVIGNQMRPVLFGTQVYESFVNAETAKTGIIPIPNMETEKLKGGHAIHWIGYDDNREVLIGRNSWGTDWGDAGYFYMPYAYLKTGAVSECFTIKSVGKAPEIKTSNSRCNIF